MVFFFFLLWLILNDLFEVHRFFLVFDQVAVDNINFIHHILQLKNFFVMISLCWTSWTIFLISLSYLYVSPYNSLNFLNIVQLFWNFVRQLIELHFFWDLLLKNYCIPFLMSYFLMFPEILCCCLCLYWSCLIFQYLLVGFRRDTSTT